jgi:hypothetical protein
LKRYGLLLLLASASILLNGYHYAVDDGGIYLPEIIQRLHPSLYPFNGQFIHAQGSLSIYAVIPSAVARAIGGSVRASVFLLHFLGVFVLLFAGLELAERMFTSTRAVWSAVCVLACTTSLFIAGTSIPIMDPYFTARTLSTPLTLVALCSVVQRKWLLTICALALAFALHPLMTFYAGLLIACYCVADANTRATIRIPAYAASTLPVGLSWGAVSGPAKQSMEMANRHFFFAARWSAFDWAGVVIPLAILFYLWRVATRAATPLLRRLCGGAFLCGMVATLFFLCVSLSPSLEPLVRLQPMRAFQLIYVVMFLVVGGLFGEYVLRAQAWRWSLLLLALGGMDIAIDRATYPASKHVEWPGATSGNAWVQGFDWARRNTPETALFALPPQYIYAAGEDGHGFRAIAERSSLADQVKDSSVVSIFPNLAPEWKQQIDAQSGWTTFSPADFHKLARQFPVTWVIVELPQSEGLDCPYRNSAVAVCRIA